MGIELIKACLDWADETDDRCVMIEHDTRYPRDNPIWCYSYKIGAGVHVSSIREIPTEEELINKLVDDMDRRKAELRR